MARDILAVIASVGAVLFGVLGAGLFLVWGFTNACRTEAMPFPVFWGNLSPLGWGVACLISILLSVLGLVFLLLYFAALEGIPVSRGLISKAVRRASESE